MSKTKIVGIRLDEELVEKIKEKAKNAYRNFTDQVRMYIEIGMKQEEKK